jgi:hypothetical protein
MNLYSTKQLLEKIRNKKRHNIRKFKSKDEEYKIMVEEATTFLLNIFESNEYTMQQELSYNFKYTSKDIQDIKDFYENANESWELVKDHSPVFLKHMKWFDSYIENKVKEPVVRKKRNYKL